MADLGLPPRRAAQEPGDMNLLEICLDIHMANTGAMDGMMPDRYHGLRDYLQSRVDNWRDHPDARWRPFDSAVYALCRATIDELHWDQR